MCVCSSIRPGSGPTLGGTVLTVSGSNLGAVGTDVSVELILIDTMNHVQCDVDTTRYIPGTYALFLYNYYTHMSQPRISIPYCTEVCGS